MITTGHFHCWYLRHSKTWAQIKLPWEHPSLTISRVCVSTRVQFKRKPSSASWLCIEKTEASWGLPAADARGEYVILSCILSPGSTPKCLHNHLKCHLLQTAIGKFQYPAPFHQNQPLLEMPHSQIGESCWKPLRTRVPTDTETCRDISHSNRRSWLCFSEVMSW